MLTQGKMSRTFFLLCECERDVTNPPSSWVRIFPWAELRKDDLEYRTPADYLNRSKCGSIDRTAVELGRTWHSRLDTMHHGISLGEMMEYDFVMYFIDALRSIEIAREIISVETPDAITVPRKIPSKTRNQSGTSSCPTR